MHRLLLSIFAFSALPGSDAARPKCSGAATAAGHDARDRETGIYRRYHQAQPPPTRRAGAMASGARM